ncbi:MAG TPA: SDR family oxidoreductase [Terriglobales bacterium]|nr:SDR family oxidoreductase [Terriglobales bacterium]
METGLKGRVAIVAAASGGLGLATAKGLAAEGVRLAICSRDPRRIQDAANQIRQNYQVEVQAQAVDVGNYQAVQNFVRATAEQFGAIHICITNAGGPPAKGFLSTTIEEWRRAVDLNFLSVVCFAKEVIPYMQRQHWGRLITITSVSVKQPVPDLVYSNAVRTAVVGLVKSLALEFGKDGILVNNVAPGFTATARLKELAAVRASAAGVSEEEIFQRWAADTALKRVGTPEELADAIVWLASDRASNITGQTILVEGGSYKGTM